MSGQNLRKLTLHLQEILAQQEKVERPTVILNVDETLRAIDVIERNVHLHPVQPQDGGKVGQNRGPGETFVKHGLDGSLVEDFKFEPKPTLSVQDRLKMSFSFSTTRHPPRGSPVTNRNAAGGVSASSTTQRPPAEHARTPAHNALARVTVQVQASHNSPPF